VISDTGDSEEYIFSNFSLARSFTLSFILDQVFDLDGVPVPIPIPVVVVLVVVVVEEVDME